MTLGAQQAVPPPPKPADNGPTLAATMQFIQDKLNDLGKVSFVMFLQNTTDGSTRSHTMIYEVSNVSADQNQCHIFFHEKVTSDGSTLFDGNYGLALRDVQDIVIKPYTQYLTDGNASAGAPNFIVTSVNPNLTALQARLPHGGQQFFPFIDADLADRVAKALTHAIELCGGGSKPEPF